MIKSLARVSGPGVIEEGFGLRPPPKKIYLKHAIKQIGGLRLQKIPQ